MWNFSFFLRQDFTLSPRQEGSGTIITHCNLCLPVSRDSCASASQVAGITAVCYHAQLIFVFSVETGFHRVGQAGLKLLTSSDPPVLVSQSARITGVIHRAWPYLFSVSPVLASAFFHGMILNRCLCHALGHHSLQNCELNKQLFFISCPVLDILLQQLKMV